MNRPDDHIFTRALSGTATEEELSSVNRWMAESDAGAQEVRQTDSLGLLLQARRASQSQQDLAWARLQLRQAQEAASHEHARVVRLYSIIRYAAACLLLLVVGGALLYHYALQSSTPEMFVCQAPATGHCQLALSDGTQVWLHQGATLRYPETFQGQSRQVQLSGEGYFEVAHDRQHPFIVDGPTLTVRVLGTKFNFQALAAGQPSQVSLIEGSVGVKSQGQRDVTVLMPGQCATLQPQTGRLMVSETDARLSAVWHDGLIPFTNANLEQIALTLSRVYGVPVSLAGPYHRQRTYSGCIQHKAHIHEALHLLQHSLPLTFRHQGDSIVLSEE